MYASLQNPCLQLSCGDTVAIYMKEIVHNHSPSRYISNSNFTLYFYYASAFLDLDDYSDLRITAHITSLEQYVLILNLHDRYGIYKVGPDTISYFILSVNIWSHAVQSLCISSISSFKYILPGFSHKAVP